MAGHAETGPPHPASLLHEVLLETEGLEEFLHQLGVVAARSLGHRAAVGVTLVRDGAPRTAASSARRAAVLDELQYEYDAGPCLTALRTREPVCVPDLRADDRFPGAYRRAAAEQGVRAVLAVPFEAAVALGVLNAYFAEVLRPGTAELGALTGFAHEAARALALAMRLVAQKQRTDQLQEAMRSRSTIDQAIGIVMAQQRCDPETAFATLRRVSQHRNVKLRIVAQEVVAGVTGTGSV